jgi:hypothetical protein
MKVLLLMLRKRPAPAFLLAFLCPKPTSSSMLSITTSTGKAASTHAHPDIAPVSGTRCTTESKVLPDALHDASPRQAPWLFPASIRHSNGSVTVRRRGYYTKRSLADDDVS